MFSQSEVLTLTRSLAVDDHWEVQQRKIIALADFIEACNPPTDNEVVFQLVEILCQLLYSGHCTSYVEAGIFCILGAAQHFDVALAVAAVLMEVHPRLSEEAADSALLALENFIYAPENRDAILAFVGREEIANFFENAGDNWNPKHESFHRVKVRMLGGGVGSGEMKA